MRESNLSSIPPCPGNMLLESLIYPALLNIDYTKSPNIAVEAVIIDMTK